MSRPADALEDDFEAWASFAARMRVGGAAHRSAMLHAAGIADRWDAIDEEWSRRINEEIAVGAMARPHRYVQLCALEAGRDQGGPSATLPLLAIDSSNGPTPFARSNSPASASAAAAAFAALRGEPVAPSAWRAESARTVASVLDAAPPETVPSSALSVDAPPSAERVLGDFRASMTPTAPVARPKLDQESTMTAIDLDALRAAARALKR